MNPYTNKVAVITGAASGIGFAIAERCVQEGMRVVLADIEEPALLQAARALEEAGGTILAVPTDVAKAEDVEALAQDTLDAFGAVDLLCNNAGVGAGGFIWDSTEADWEWVLGVNLWGVIHGLRTFVPIMLAQNTNCYVVNTASVAGLLPYQPSAPYHATKHAVVALSEHLAASMTMLNARIRVAVLCPGWVNTRIMDAERNRPDTLQNPADGREPSSAELAVVASLHRAARAGLSPQKVAGRVFEALQAGQFYIFTDEEFKPAVRARLEAILRQLDTA